MADSLCAAPPAEVQLSVVPLPAGEYGAVVVVAAVAVLAPGVFVIAERGAVAYKICADIIVSMMSAEGNRFTHGNACRGHAVPLRRLRQGHGVSTIRCCRNLTICRLRVLSVLRKQILMSSRVQRQERLLIK